MYGTIYTSVPIIYIYTLFLDKMCLISSNIAIVADFHSGRYSGSSKVCFFECPTFYVQFSRFAIAKFLKAQTILKFATE